MLHLYRSHRRSASLCQFWIVSLHVLFSTVSPPLAPRDVAFRRNGLQRPRCGLLTVDVESKVDWEPSMATRISKKDFPKVSSAEHSAVATTSCRLPLHWLSPPTTVNDKNGTIAYDNYAYQQ